LAVYGFQVVDCGSLEQVNIAIMFFKLSIVGP